LLREKRSRSRQVAAGFELRNAALQIPIRCGCQASDDRKEQ
jgi:hypothetical protein